MLSAPFWLYQLWAFITPGLKRQEKRYGIGFVAVSTLLFAAGAVLAYISLSKGLQLLLGLAGDGVVVALTAQDYIGFVLSLLVAFGVSFEVPLIAVALNLVGVLPYEVLAKSRRWIFFLTIVFAAFITPTQDPFTMLLMAGPMIVLFEGAIQIARVVDKRRARRAGDRGLPRRRRRRGLAAGRPAVRRWTTPTTRQPPIDARPVDRRRRPRQPYRRPRPGPRPHRRVLTAFREAGLTPHAPAGDDRRGRRAAGGRAVADGAGAVVAVGGDGTVHAALQAVAGTAAALAVVPAGTGNDLVLALGIPRTRRPRPAPPPRTCLRPRPHDRRRPDGRPLVGHGALLRLRLRRHRPGQPAALAEGTPPVRRRRPRRAGPARPVELTLVLDGEAQTVPVTMVAVGNTPWYGGGMKVCPAADPTDGLFDVTVVGRDQPARADPHQAAAHGRHPRRAPEVSVYRAARVELSSPGVTTYADGEPVAPLPAVAECVPGALRSSARPPRRREAVDRARRRPTIEGCT